MSHLTARQKVEFLLLLDELLVNAEYRETDPEDWSGCNTRYRLDTEQFRANIQAKLTQLQTEPPTSCQVCSGLGVVEARDGSRIPNPCPACDGPEDDRMID